MSQGWDPQSHLAPYHCIYLGPCQATHSIHKHWASVTLRAVGWGRGASRKSDRDLRSQSCRETRQGHQPLSYSPRGGLVH